MTDFGPEMPMFSELAPGVRRLVAPNPSMMTGPGTNTYLFGVAEVAVLDPGPVIESHLEKILEIAGAPIRYVMVTHTHPDHSPAAVELARMSGSKLVGIPPPNFQHQDLTFDPSVVPADGDMISIDNIDLQMIHTPGHASNHICIRHVDLNWVFTGDHVIDGSTVVINPPDGNMKHYLESLAKVRALRPNALAPGHGELIQDADKAIDWIVDHRLERERKVLDGLRANPGLTSMELVPHVYKDVDEKLYGWAERSLLAHLMKLESDEVAQLNDDRWTARQDDSIAE